MSPFSTITASVGRCTVATLETLLCRVQLLEHVLPGNAEISRKHAAKMAERLNVAKSSYQANLQALASTDALLDRLYP